jgi:predicted phosphodiesterase
MRIAALSDMHGQLPEINEIRPVDAVLIAGDIFPLRTDKNAGESLKWINTTFFDWIKELPAKKVIVTPGKHDSL